MEEAAQEDGNDNIEEVYAALGNPIPQPKSQSLSRSGQRRRRTRPQSARDTQNNRSRRSRRSVTTHRKKTGLNV